MSNLLMEYEQRIDDSALLGHCDEGGRRAAAST